MNRIKQMITKISKYLFENIQSLLVVVAVIMAIILFFYKQAQIEPQLLQLRRDFDTYVTQANTKHQELASNQQESKHTLELSLAKLETSLAQINTDIQFIKQRIVFGEVK